MKQVSILKLREKVSQYRVFSGSYFHVFSLNTGKYGPEKAPYLETLFAQCTSF